jgi:hypothetical protein
METDRDSSGGTSPSRQGAGTETSVAQNLSSMAAALRNYSGKNADSPRIFHPEASYRRKGGVRGGPGWPHHRWARPGPGPRPLVVRAPSSPLRLPFGPRPSSGQNRSFGLRFVQFREYFLCSFSETQKTAENRELALWHLVNRLVPEIA